jgi:hypothetical protein
VLALDGARYAIQSSELSLRRLLDALDEIALVSGDHKKLRSIILRATTDAWSIIDSINRLRRFLAMMPRIRRKSPEIRLFDQATRSVKQLRNYVQHMDEQVMDTIAAGLPLWGVLTWRTKDGPEENRQNVVAVVAGTFYPGAKVALAPLGPPCLVSVGSVILSVGKESADLRKAVGSASRILEWLESTFVWDGTERKRCNIDLLIRASPLLNGPRGKGDEFVLAATAN